MGARLWHGSSTGMDFAVATACKFMELMPMVLAKIVVMAFPPSRRAVTWMV